MEIKCERIDTREHWETANTVIDKVIKDNKSGFFDLDLMHLPTGKTDIMLFFDENIKKKDMFVKFIEVDIRDGYDDVEENVNKIFKEVKSKLFNKKLIFSPSGKILLILIFEK